MKKFFADSSLWTPEFRRLCLAALCFFASHHLLTPLMPLYFRSLALNGAQIGLLVATFMASSLVLRPLVGKFADEWPAKQLMLAGLTLFIACPLAYGFLAAEPALWIARAIHGAGFALFYTSCSSWVTKAVPAARKAEGIGHYSNAIKVAMGFAPSLGLWIIGKTSFQTAFWIASLLALITLVSILGLPTHARVERRGKWFQASALFPGSVMAMNSLAFGALIPFASLLAAEKGLHCAKAFYVVYAFFLIFSRGFGGRQADLRGRDAVIIPGMLTVALSVVLLALTQNSVVFLMSTALYGLGAGLVQPALMALTADRSPSHERGSAMATFTMLNDLGIAAGSYAMGLAGGAAGYGSTLLGIALAVCTGMTFFVVRRNAATPAFESTQEQTS